MLKFIYTKLFRALGPQGWWHADSLLEICVGIILVQRTTWVNANRAIERLKKAGMLNIDKISSANLKLLSQILRPAGFYKQKTRYIRAFARYVRENYRDNLESWFRKPKKQLRQELMSIEGIGPETADSILLYAANKPIFVIDAYTKRIFYRLGIINKENIGYQELQNFVHQNLELNVRLYNEFHALLVELGKKFCRTEPKCKKCPLKQKCKFYQERTD